MRNLLLLALALAAAPLWGQIGNGTVAGLPAASGHTNEVTIVADCPSLIDCSTGGGSVVQAVRSNGSAWVVAFWPVLTASRAAVSDSNGYLSASAATAAEVGHLSGVTSGLQGQLDGKQGLDGALTALAGGVVDSTDSTSFILMVDSATGDLQLKTDAGATYNASTGAASFTSLAEGANAVPNATDHLGFFAATTSAQLAGVLSDETGSAGGFVRATASSTVGQVLRVGAGPTIGFGAVDLADSDAVTGLLPEGNIDAAIARDSEITAAIASMVTAASTFGTDNVVLRADGTGRGAQASGCAIDDSGVMTCAGFSGDPAVQAGLILPETTANGGTFSFRVYGAADQSADGCVVLSGAVGDDQILKGTASTVTIDGKTCRVMAAEADATAGSPTFDQVGSGSNTTATMTVGTGASLAPTGSGTITANVAPTEAYDATGWNGDTAPPQKDAVRDQIETMLTSIAAKAPLADPVFTGSMAIPQGASPTTDAAGECAIDTTSGQLQCHDGTAERAWPHIMSSSFTIAAVATTDDLNLMKTPYGMTIVGIDAIIQGGTNVVGQIQECNSSGASCADLDSDITVDTDGAADDGSLTDSAIASGGWLRWKTTSVSGTVDFLTVTVRYRVVAD